jgi:hypothetical protein
LYSAASVSQLASLPPSRVIANTPAPHSATTIGAAIHAALRGGLPIAVTKLARSGQRFAGSTSSPRRTCLSSHAGVGRPPLRIRPDAISTHSRATVSPSNGCWPRSAS